MFAEIQRADTVGTFQIESRAQMQSLLRTKPETIDDLTVQVALVRPGPIQGKAVHPYIEHRRLLREDPTFVYPVDHESLREPLRSTLGVVVFQDQVLDVAIALAGFTVGEAEGLRRAMSRKRSHAALESHRTRFVEGAVENSVDEKVADTRLRQARRLLGLRLPEVARGRVRAARLPVAVAAPPLPGRVPLLAAERPADGLLPAGKPRPRRAAARGGGAPARRQPQRGLVLARRLARPRIVLIQHRARRRCGSGSRTSSRWGRTTQTALVAERDANGPFRDVGDLARRAPLSKDGLVALVEGGACDCLGVKRRDLLWELGLATRPASVPGTQGAVKQLTLSLDPTAATPELAGPHAVGADGGRLSPHGPLGRHPPADAPPPAPAGGDAAERRPARAQPPLDASPMRASRSRGSGPRPPTGSCSCCSRTSAVR